MMAEEEEEEVEVEGEEEEGESRGVLTETVATDAEPSPSRKYGNRLDIDNMPVCACGRATSQCSSAVSLP